MPNTLTSPCRHPGCAELVTDGPYCTAHRRTQSAKAIYDATRRQDDPALAQAARIRGSARWQTFRAWFRSRHPLCCDPFGEHGDLSVPTRQIHHVVGLILRPDLACDEANCRPLCTRCHARVERIERDGQSTAELFSNAR